MARKSCLGTEPTPMDYFSESQDANNARAIVPAIKTEYVVVVRALIYNNSRGCHALTLKTTPCRRLSIYMLLSDARAPFGLRRRGVATSCSCCLLDVICGPIVWCWSCELDFLMAPYGGNLDENFIYSSTSQHEDMDFKSFLFDIRRRLLCRL